MHVNTSSHPIGSSLTPRSPRRSLLLPRHLHWRASESSERVAALTVRRLNACVGSCGRKHASCGTYSRTSARSATKSCDSCTAAAKSTRVLAPPYHDTACFCRDDERMLSAKEILVRLHRIHIRYIVKRAQNGPLGKQVHVVADAEICSSVP